MPMTFQEEGGRLTAVIQGEVDHHGARGMMLALDREVALRRPTRLQVDLSQVTFMDSSGIAVLLRAWRRMGAAGGAMEVRPIPPQPWRVFQAAGLDKIIPMEPPRGL